MNNNKQIQDHGKNQIIQPQKCPRCDSTNTKFCYYNNYSLSQPRHFCKACRRYWTQGGTLRNVPVGGGCRRGKRPKTAASSSSQPPTSDNYLGGAATGNFLSSPPSGAVQTSFSQPIVSAQSASTAMLSLLQGLGDVAQHGQFYMSLNNHQQVTTGGPSNINSFSVPQLQSFNNNNNDNNINNNNNNDMISAVTTNGSDLSRGVNWNDIIGDGDVRGLTVRASGGSLVNIPDDQWPELPRSYGSPPP